MRSRVLCAHVHPVLHDAKAAGDECGVGQRRVRCRIGACAVIVRERRRLIDEYTASQVDRQRDAGILGDRDRIVVTLGSLEYAESVNAP